MEPQSIECKCCLCQKRTFFMTPFPKVKTTRLVIMILQALKQLKPDVVFFSLIKDIIPFVTQHMTLLANLKIFKTGKWRKSLLDALNHSSHVESGKEACHNRGFYRLKDTVEAQTSNSIESASTEVVQQNPQTVSISLLDSLTELQLQMVNTVNLLAVLPKPTEDDQNAYQFFANCINQLNFGRAYVVALSNCIFI
ncbi:hypothetical protein EIN_410980 [Entamoeba invadens IP1]|uniref:Uncharacterized protein n=1 Tax=Entamoeba invadens IP1 TaxID=370355 RepID=A0A0A1U159_ENTIV|nr:hypothetical protein EIN_410980 [Entamoeba invadens IP1]ELP87745.1 hypothetical protein EIN_410980 [Entamoeba invadens IP1]|eukprot:XP_004254516.1 hypothetical protein EIN_410980 [Entamoeba invadens IP1]